MSQAIKLAKRAEQEGEVPVGALIVQGDECIAEGWNQPIKLHDATAHAEMLAIRNACQSVQNYRLIDTTLYVTLEPCVMCMGAIQHARISRVVFAATDPKRGALCSALTLATADYTNHHIQWTGGVCAAECSALLTNFFKSKRK